MHGVCSVKQAYELYVLLHLTWLTLFVTKDGLLTCSTMSNNLIKCKLARSHYVFSLLRWISVCHIFRLRDKLNYT